MKIKVTRISGDIITTMLKTNAKNILNIRLIPYDPKPERAGRGRKS